MFYLNSHIITKDLEFQPRIKTPHNHNEQFYDLHKNNRGRVSAMGSNQKKMVTQKDNHFKQT
jgi:hypothetical protein